MPTLGLSQKAFKVGQQHNFKVFGDDLANSNATALTTTAPNLMWQNLQTVGKAQHHVNIQATLVAVFSVVKVTDAIGDLTVTVTDSGTGQQTTTTFTPVAYTN